MIIDFLSVNKHRIDQNINGIHVKALLVKNPPFVNFKSDIKCDINFSCDRCSDSEVKLTTINCDFKIANDSSDDDEVMYEFFDNKIDIGLILESEINAVKSDYYICNKCKTK